MAVAIDRFAFGGNDGSYTVEEITGNQWDNALKRIGWREAHNAHMLKRLKERGASFGVRTLNDLAQALRGGVSEDANSGAMARISKNGRFRVIYKNNEFITLTGP